MNEYLSPGVYVEEISSGVKPIEGVGTSTGAFVGIAEKGPIGQAILIPNWTHFVRVFGSFIKSYYLAHAVYQFFKEGGTRCYVVRTCHYEKITEAKSKTAKNSTEILKDESDNESILISALSEGKWGDRICVETIIPPEQQQEKKFSLFVKFEKEKSKYENDDKKEYEIKESYPELTMNNIEERINGKSEYITVEKDAWEEGTKLGSGEIPKDQSIILINGNDGLVIEDDGEMKSTLMQADFIGDSSALNGLHAFDPMDINIVAIPDRSGDRNTTLDGLNYCQNRKDCFFIADPPSDITPIQVKDYKNGTGDYLGNAFNSSFGALYYPWVLINDPLTGNPIPVPPSGAAAGTISYVDSIRGVHKPPAGTPDGYLDSVVGIERIVTKGEHDILNPEGINIIRKFPTSGICIWGARTLARDPEWKYINIRRLFLYLEESIDLATQWVVFEPNTPSLWGAVIRNITAFLLTVWRNGALFGNTPDEAFIVKCDEELNPEEVRNIGQLIIEIGVAPVRPAEFVIIRISQKTKAK
jgi:phage tail sheath protein FI